MIYIEKEMKDDREETAIQENLHGDELLKEECLSETIWKTPYEF